MKQAITLLGSTGSIGRQTLDVCRQMGIQVAALAAHHSVDQLEEQVREFKPGLAVLYDIDAALELAKRLAGLPVRVSYGMEGLVEAASLPETGPLPPDRTGRPRRARDLSDHRRSALFPDKASGRFFPKQPPYIFPARPGRSQRLSRSQTGRPNQAKANNRTREAPALQR